jgi:hypothetical protein
MSRNTRSFQRFYNFSTSIAGSDVIYFVHNSLHFLCANSFKNDYFIKKLENATNITLPEQAEQ